MITEYALYNSKEELLFVGNYRECSNFLGCTTSTFYHNFSKFSRGLYKNPKVRIYKIEFEEGELS